MPDCSSPVSGPFALDRVEDRYCHLSVIFLVTCCRYVTLCAFPACSPSALADGEEPDELAGGPVAGDLEDTVPSLPSLPRKEKWEELLAVAEGVDNGALDISWAEFKVTCWG